jgi:hypothetical protein
MGTFEDEICYTVDTSGIGRISPDVIGIFLYLPFGESLQIDEDKLREMIEAFLPVYVRVVLNTVELPLEEVYRRSCISERHEDLVNDWRTEEIIAAKGSFCTEVSWKLLCSFKEETAEEPSESNDCGYRSYHNQISFPGVQKRNFKV